MESFVATGVRDVSRRGMVRLRGVASTALLLSGMLAVWGGPLAGPVAAATGDWSQFHNGPTHSGYNAQETTLSTSNVGALGLAWTGTTGSAIYFSSPTVANGVVYVGSEDDKLYAYAAGCASGGASCAPLWTAAAAAWSSPRPPCPTVSSTFHPTTTRYMPLTLRG